MSVSRKIELARQIEEMRLLVNEQATDLPPSGRKKGLSQGVIDERLARQRGILATLEWLKDNEIDFRAWKKGQGDGHHPGDR